MINTGKLAWCVVLALTLAGAVHAKPVPKALDDQRRKTIHPHHASPSVGHKLRHSVRNQQSRPAPKLAAATHGHPVKHTRPKAHHARPYRAEGLASWYGREAGSHTANGKHFNPRHLTAAHRTLPLATKVRVTNLANRRSVVVMVNDRGPFVGHRLIDLSYGAAKALAIQGTARVKVVALE